MGPWGLDCTFQTLGPGPRAFRRAPHLPLAFWEAVRAGPRRAGMGGASRPLRRAVSAPSPHNAPRQEAGATASGTSSASPGGCCVRLVATWCLCW